MISQERRAFFHCTIWFTREPFWTKRLANGLGLELLLTSSGKPKSLFSYVLVLLLVFFITFFLFFYFLCSFCPFMFASLFSILSSFLLFCFLFVTFLFFFFFFFFFVFPCLLRRLAYKATNCPVTVYVNQEHTLYKDIVQDVGYGLGSGAGNY